MVRGIYFGWYVVAAAIVIYALLLGSTFASFGLYILPVSEEFGLSRADINTGLIMLNLGNATMAPIIGRLLDRVSARKVMMVCGLLLGASLTAIGLSHSLVIDGALIALPVAAGVLGGGTISVSVLLARWFSAYRGRALALAALGMSLGGIFVSPLVGYLIEAYGWRMSLIVTGCGSGVIVLLLAFLMRDWPGPNDIEVRGQVARKEAAASQPSLPPVQEPIPTVLDFLRMRLFWFIAGGIALGGAIGQGVTVSLVPIALEAGLTTMDGAVLISASGVSGMVAMLALAAWGDRMDRTTLLSLVMLSAAVPCVLLLFAKTWLALLATALILGLALAVVMPVYIALIADRFGLVAFGTVRGLMVPVMSLTGAVSVRFIGEVYDRSGSYEFGLWTYLVLAFVSAGLVYSTRPRSV
jgi:MFS family permease